MADTNQCTPVYPGDAVVAKLASAYRVDTVRGVVYGPRGKEVGNIGTDGYYRLTIYTYARKQSKRNFVRRSHVIWWAHHGKWPTQELDHDNRNKVDDRITNLKASTRAEQMMNRDYTVTLPLEVIHG